jgi:excisionase family DNA binding protein
MAQHRRTAHKMGCRKVAESKGIWEMSESNFSNAKFLTVAEVAEVMRVSKMTVYRLVHSGEMPAVRFGRSYRVPENAVEQYLKGAVVDGQSDTA